MRTATKIGSMALTFALALSALTTTLVTPSQARAEEGPTEDSVRLTDGRTITGRIVGEDEEFVSIRAGGVLRAYPKSRVESLIRGAPAASPVPTADGDSAEPATTAPGDPKAAKKAGKKRARQPASDAAPERLSAEAQAWLTELLNRMRSPAARDQTVRASLASALRTLGPTAVAPIRAAAQDADAEVADVLKRTAAAIERGAAARRATGDGGGDGRDGARPGDAMGDEESDGAASAATRRASVLASLGLSREQAVAVKDLVREHLMQRRDIYREARAEGAARDEVVAQFGALRAKTIGAIRVLLDAEQVEKFDAAADTFMEAIESRAKGPGTKKKAKQKKGGADEASQ